MKIQYSDFLQVLLGFSLASRECALAKLLAVFQVLDSDRNGIIDGTEFENLLRALELGLFEEDIQRLLKTVDPYTNQSITFSDCVSLLEHEEEVLDLESSETPISLLSKCSAS